MGEVPLYTSSGVFPEVGCVGLSCAGLCCVGRRSTHVFFDGGGHRDDVAPAIRNRDVSCPVDAPLCRVLVLVREVAWRYGCVRNLSREVGSQSLYRETQSVALQRNTVSRFTVGSQSLYKETEAERPPTTR